MPTIGEFLFALGFGKADTKPLDDAVDKGEEGAKKVESAWLSAGKGIGKGLAAIGVAAVGAGGSLFGLAANSAAAAASVDDLAKRSGNSARDIQRLNFAAAQGGASTEDMTAALRKLDLAIVDAAKGTGPASDAFDLLGLSVKDFTGLDAEAKLGLIADALGSIHDPATRTSLAMDVLGRGGTTLIPVLEGGAEALRAAGDEAERLGLVLSDETIAAGAELDDTIAAMKATLAGLVTSLGADLIPLVQATLEETKAWIVANKDLIKVQVTKAIDAIVHALETLGPILLDIIELIIDIVNWFGESENAATRMVLALVALGAAVTAAAGPWGALAVALALVVTRFDEIVEGASRAIEAIDPFAELRDAALREAEGGDIEVHGTRQANVFLPGEARDRQAFAAAAEATRAANEAASTAVAIASGKATAKSAQALAMEGRRRALANKKKKGKGGKDFEEDISAGMFEFDEEHGDMLRRLAAQHGVGEAGIDAALKAGAESLAGGSNVDVARSAALSQLSQRAGVDLSAKTKDPLLSELFGENVPDVELSKLAMGAEPQVLIATINNTFNFDNTFDIDGAGDPENVGHAVVEVLEQTLQAAIEQSTKTAKVVWAR